MSDRLTPAEPDSARTPEYWQQEYEDGRISFIDLLNGLIVAFDGEKAADYLERIEPQHRTAFKTALERYPLSGTGAWIGYEGMSPSDAVISGLREVLCERVAQGWLPAQDDGGKT
jgi:hypothetical protein